MIRKMMALIALSALPCSGMAQDVDAARPAEMAQANAEWTSQPADGDKAPGVGGRIDQRYRIGQANAVLASFDLVSRLSGSPAGIADVTSDDALYGASSLTFTPGSTATTQVRPTAAHAPVDVRGQIVRWWAKGGQDVNARLGTFSIRLYSAGSPFSPGANYHVYAAAGDVKTALGNGDTRWMSFSASPAAFTAVGTGADLSAIAFAVIDMAAASTTSQMILRFGNVEVVPNGIAKAKFIVAFDDMSPLTVQYASRAMARYGFRGVLYPSSMIALGQPGKLTVPMVKNLHDNLGWQIASQAYSTENNVGAGGIDLMTSDQRTAEMAKLRNMHNALGLTGGAHGSYFSNVGVTDMIAYPMFRQHFRSMRAYYFGPVPPETFPWGDPMRIKAQGAGEFQYNSDADLFTNRWKPYIDSAIAQKGVAFLVFHGGLNTPGVSWQSSFDAMMTYLDAERANIDVVTVDDLEMP
ncbi:hypothetical protein NUH86_07575 [Sphingobium sp. JS3065]|uniref:hypothetical protein n=1 Tax=Sphingobium sp. JS3065 TaxID=2970925 RepID=UPI002264D30B|nr:hypothetical protein [Sphingobium sp. JS3065]UZW56603.1 hypothetical protein NUH86_07575 [Sphingobium sp. JS3065]